MNKEEFVEKLQMVYTGDRNAFNEIVSEYDKLQNSLTRIDKAIKYIEEKQKIQYKYTLSKIECEEVLSILRGASDK